MSGPQPTGPVEVVNDGPDTTSRTAAWNKTYEFNPTAGVAFLQVDHIYQVTDSGGKDAYILGCGIDHIDVWVGGSIAYTVYDWCHGVPAGGVARNAAIATPINLLSASSAYGGQLMELNRYLFGGPYEEHFSTTSIKSASYTGVRSYKLPIFKPDVGVKNQKIKIQVWFATPNQWTVYSAGAPTAAVDSLQTVIMCQYADQMPEFDYINYSRTGIGASLNKSYDVALDEKKGKNIIGVIAESIQSSAFVDYITKLYLVDTNGTPWSQMTAQQMSNEVAQRSSAMWIKTGVTTGAEVAAEYNVGNKALKVDGVESNGKVKIAIDTHASASALALQCLVLLRTQGAPVATTPGKSPVSIQADQSGGVSTRKA